MMEDAGAEHLILTGASLDPKFALVSTIAKIKADKG